MVIRSSHGRSAGPGGILRFLSLHQDPPAAPCPRVPPTRPGRVDGASNADGRTPGTGTVHAQEEGPGASRSRLSPRAADNRAGEVRSGRREAPMIDADGGFYWCTQEDSNPQPSDP